MRPQDVMLGPGMVRATDGAEARRVGEITGDAFRDDPVSRWMLGTEGAIRGMFGTLATSHYAPHGLAYRLGDEGACMWMLPGGEPELPFWTEQRIRLTILLRASRGAVGRVTRAVAAMDAAHPAFPHAYLFSVGVRPGARGKGLGRRLLAPVLAACDEAGLPAYLENSNPANTGFYTAAGFEHRQWLAPRADAPPFQAMLRQPR